MKRLIGTLLVLAALGCGGKKESPEAPLDVVNGTSPVSSTFGSIKVTLDELAALPPNQRLAKLNADWPHLATDVTAYLGSHGMVPRGHHVERIRFVFGSADNINAKDHDGVTHKGFFKNQLIARVMYDGIEKPHDYIVQCFNGMVYDESAFSSQQNLGEVVPERRFTIDSGEGLVHHVDYPTAIDIAERCGLPLYKGKVETNRHAITPAEARRLELKTDQVQVTVRVYPGDTFDLDTGGCPPKRP